MTDTATLSGSVLLSQSLGHGTVGQAVSERDNAGTKSGTTDLKALARKVLRQDGQRDACGTACPKLVAQAPRRVGQDQGLAAGQSRSPGPSVPNDDPEERPAIIAEGAGVPRLWAEGFAALCAMPPQAGFSPERWRRIIDETGHFLDIWAGEAIRCGWSDLDVVGCHPNRPTARFDCMGLVLLLDRCEVMSIDRDGADLKTVTGAHQRFYRRPMPPGTVVLWELTLHGRG
jgi:hypothetical protein